MALDLPWESVRHTQHSRVIKAGRRWDIRNSRRLSDHSGGVELIVKWHLVRISS